MNNIITYKLNKILRNFKSKCIRVTTTALRMKPTHKLRQSAHNHVRLLLQYGKFI